MNERAHGREAVEQAFNPFKGYLNWRESRQSARPVHQEFANLAGEDPPAELRAFLETYGPLTIDAEDAVGRKSIRADAFWSEHEVFDFAYQLVVALRPDRMNQLKGTLRAFAEATQGRTLTSDSLLARLQDAFNVHPEGQPGGDVDARARVYADAVRSGVLRAIRCGSPAALRKYAQRFLTRIFSERLSGVHPLLAFEPDPTVSVSRLATWSCTTLREALWMMLFLDITSDRRIVRCEHCGDFFADAKENVRFCSYECEKKSRNLRWWRRHGKHYRANRAKAKKVTRRAGARGGRD